MTDQQPHTTLHLTTIQILIGAVPALIGVVGGIMNLRQPLTSHNHQGVLIGALVALVCCTFFLLLLFAASSIARDFNARDDELDALLRQHAEASAHDYRAAMAKLSKSCKRLDALIEQHERTAEELEHLRKLLLDGADWPRHSLS